VVQPAVLVHADAEPILEEQCAQFFGEGGVGPRRIADTVQFRREAVEIVDRFEFGGGADRRRCCFPMRADDDDRARSGQFGSRSGQCGSRRSGLEHHRRRAVGNEEGWEMG
jgi:hypothetical protein